MHEALLITIYFLHACVGIINIYHSSSLISRLSYKILKLLHELNGEQKESLRCSIYKLIAIPTFFNIWVMHEDDQDVGRQQKQIWELLIVDVEVMSTEKINWSN